MIKKIQRFWTAFKLAFKNLSSPDDSPEPLAENIRVYSWQVVDNTGHARTVGALQTKIGLEGKIRIARILAETGYKDLMEIDPSISQILSFLGDHDMLMDVLDSLLIRKPGCEKNDFGAMDYATTKRVVQDFLSLNPELVGDLSGLWANTLTSLTRQMLARPLRSKSDTSAPAQA